MTTPLADLSTIATLLAEMAALWTDNRICDTANERIAAAKANNKPQYVAEALVYVHLIVEMRDEYVSRVRMPEIIDAIRRLEACVPDEYDGCTVAGSEEDCPHDSPHL